MLDLSYIRSNTDQVREAMKALNTTAPIDEILELDEKRREMLSRVETLRAERNTVSKEIPHIKDPHEKQSLIAKMRQVGDEIKIIEVELGPTQEKLDTLMMQVPNMPDESVPVGLDESENLILRQAENLPQFDFEPRPPLGAGRGIGYHRL